MSIESPSTRLSTGPAFCALILFVAQSNFLQILAKELNFQSTSARLSAYSTGGHQHNATARGRSSAEANALLSPKEDGGVDVGLRSRNSSMRVDEKSAHDYEEGDTRVPFWNIAHMINSIEQIQPALDAGANGIEVDVSFDKQGVPVDAYHGFPCDCGRHCHYRESFIKFVQHLAKITTNKADSRLLIVIFDLKLKDLKADQEQVAGRQLASILDEHLYKKYLRESHSHKTPLRVVISINHVSDHVLVRSFMKYVHEQHLNFLSRQVGFDVGMNDNLTDILAMWDSMPGLTFNVWQGDGLTNCANLIRGVERLKEAISIRNEQGHFRKIYYWTADMMYQIRSILRFGLDAILTNQPERVKQILDEPEFKVKYRLASPYDDPFMQFWIKPSAWKLSAPSLSEAIETVTNIRATSERFIKTLPDGIAAAIQKVQHSISHIR